MLMLMYWGRNHRDQREAHAQHFLNCGHYSQLITNCAYLLKVVATFHHFAITFDFFIFSDVFANFHHVCFCLDYLYSTCHLNIFYILLPEPPPPPGPSCFWAPRHYTTWKCITTFGYFLQYSSIFRELIFLSLFLSTYSIHFLPFYFIVCQFCYF